MAFFWMMVAPGFAPFVSVPPPPIRKLDVATFWIYRLSSC
jgi:hypothetical protein